MDPRTRLDHALFQLTPTRTRCELVIVAGGRSENVSSGLLEPFLSHLKSAKEQVQKGGYSITLQPPSPASWFTKGTLERFVKFVGTPEILERFVTIEREIEQIQSSIQSKEQSVLASEGNFSVLDENPEDFSASSTGTSKWSSEAGQEERSKVQLLCVLETRRAVLKKEQAMAFARALVAGFEIDCVEDLVSFSNAFGASRLRCACIDFMELCKKKKDDGVWMDEIAAMQAYSHPDLPFIRTSAVQLTSKDNDHNQENSTAIPDQVQFEDGRPEVSIPWPNHVRHHMQNFPGHPFQELHPYQGYSFPGMQVPAPYYPGNVSWPPNIEESSLGLDQGPDDPWKHNFSSRKKEKSSHQNRSKAFQHDDSWEPSEYSNSGSDSNEEHHDGEKATRKKHKRRSTRKVVIQNINYITSKGGREVGDSSGGDSSGEHDGLINVQSLEKHLGEAAARNNMKKRDGSKKHRVVNGFASATKNDNEIVQEDKPEGENRNQTWDIFQNLLLRETDSGLNGIDEHHAGFQEDYEINKISRGEISTAIEVVPAEIKIRFALNESPMVTDKGRDNENYQQTFKKGGGTFEELLVPSRTEHSQSQALTGLSDTLVESSITVIHQEGDWFPESKFDKSFTNGATNHKIFDAGLQLTGDSYFLGKDKKDSIPDDSFMVQSRPLIDGPSASQLTTDVSVVSEVFETSRADMYQPDISLEKVEATGVSEPGDLSMVLGRNSAVEQVVTSWIPEMDYGSNSLKHSRETIPDQESTDCVGTKKSSGNEGTKSQSSGDIVRKFVGKEARAKPSSGSLGKNKSGVLSKSQKPSSGTRNMTSKSKTEKEEEDRQRKEALLILREKRIAERSTSRSPNLAVTRKTSKENMKMPVSTKIEKPKLKSPKQEVAKQQKPIIRNSTIDRLASARVTQKLSSAEVKSIQPRKQILYASKTEKKKAGASSNVNPSGKRSDLKKPNGTKNYSGTQRAMDGGGSKIEKPEESSNGKFTQGSGEKFYPENIKEMYHFLI